MLRAFIRILTSPITFKKESPSPTPKKHLVMQTHYTYTTPPASEMINIEIESLIKQQQLLLKQPAFADAVIEIHLLNKETFLLGFTKHAQTLLNGVFMYPKQIYATEQWTTVVKKANENKMGIAVFKPKQDIDCLKVTQNDGQKSTLYLVDHRAIAAVEMMHLPT